MSADIAARLPTRLAGAEGAMLLERTLTTLQSRAETPERARELGRLAFVQWLFWLRPDASHADEARRALRLAEPLVATDPAVAAFCALVRESMAGPAIPKGLTLPPPRRRGGAKARRAAF